MFCEKCGNKISKNEAFCSNCGAPIPREVSVETVKTEQSTVNLACEPIPEAAAFAPEEIVKPKKKFRIPKPVMAVVLAVVLLGASFALPSVRNFFARAFMSPETYFKHVIKNNIKDFASDVGEVTRECAKRETLKGSLTLTKGDKLDELLKECDVEASPEWLDSATLTFDSATEDDRVSADLGMKVNQKDFVSLNLDVTDEGLYVESPEINSKALKVEFGPENSGAGTIISDCMSIFTEITEIVPEEKVLEKMIVEYTMLLAESVEDVSEEKVKLEAGGVTQKCVMLSTDIDEDVMQKALKSVLEKAKDDEEIERMIKECANKIDGVSSKEVYDSFRDGIEDALDNIDDIEYDEDVTFKLYVNNSGKIIGFTFEIDEGVIEYYSVQKGKALGTKFVCGTDDEGVEFEGSGAVKKGKFSGEYALVANDSKIVELSVENVDVKLWKNKDIFNGKITVTPSKAIDNAFGSEHIISRSKFVIESATEEEKSAKYAFSVYTDGGLVAKLDIDAVMEEARKVSVPSDYVDVSNHEEFEAWAETATTNLKKQLKAVGVPAELVDGIAN